MLQNDAARRFMGIQKSYRHAAPLGLSLVWCICCYRHIAPLGLNTMLFVGTI